LLRCLRQHAETTKSRQLQRIHPTPKTTQNRSENFRAITKTGANEEAVEEGINADADLKTHFDPAVNKITAVENAAFLKKESQAKVLPIEPNLQKAIKLKYGICKMFCSSRGRRFNLYKEEEVLDLKIGEVA
jgi:hypothetical protein